MDELFNVVLFFPDDSHHYERRNVTAEEAVICAKDCTQRPAARIGMITRIIITDSGDLTVFAWEYGKGITFDGKDHYPNGKGSKVMDVSPQPPENEATYIGDGVYASYDGYHIWLKTERENGMHQIALEPKTFSGLIGYAQKLGWIR